MFRSRNSFRSSNRSKEKSALLLFTVTIGGNWTWVKWQKFELIEIGCVLRTVSFFLFKTMQARSLLKIASCVWDMNPRTLSRGQS